MNTLYAPDFQDEEDFDPWATPSVPTAPSTHVPPVPAALPYSAPTPVERAAYVAPVEHIAPPPVAPIEPQEIVAQVSASVEHVAPAQQEIAQDRDATEVPPRSGPQRRARRAPRDYSERPAAPIVSRVEAPVAPAAPIEVFVPVEPKAATPLAEDPALDLFTPAPVKTVSEPTVLPRGEAKLLIIWGAKGGVGKTTLALVIAERAAATGKKVVLIDGNRGQGDLRTYLRLNGKSLPTIFDATLGHDTQKIIVGPKALNDAREKHEGVLHFALVQAPLERQADPAIVTGNVYNSVINAARDLADLVIVDTQIVEGFDTSGLVGSVLTPSLARGAYSIAVTDYNPAGTTNLINRLSDFAAAGSAKDHTFVIVNRVPDVSVLDEAKMAQVFGKTASYLGSIGNDDAISATMTSGNVPKLDAAGSKLLDYALWQVTGDSKFNQAADVPSQSSRRRMFGKG